jgi:DNA-binding CsgD family transcriptional regulator
VPPLLEVLDPPNRQAVPTTLHGSTGAWTALLADPTHELTHTLHRVMLHSGSRDIILAYSVDQVDEELGRHRGAAELAVVSARFGTDTDPIIRKLRQAGWDRVLVFAPVGDVAATVSAFQAGATGVLSWPTVYSELAPPRLALTLSAREKDVLALVAGGLNNRQIGIELGLSTATVKRYLAGISNAIGTDNRSHMATIALRAGALEEGVTDSTNGQVVPGGVDLRTDRSGLRPLDAIPYVDVGHVVGIGDARGRSGHRVPKRR